MSTSLFSINITSENTISPNVRINGNFRVIITGTWSGIITLQKEVTPDWYDVDNFTTNVNKKYNSDGVYRLICKSGNYVSGTAVCSLNLVNHNEHDTDYNDIIDVNKLGLDSITGDVQLGDESAVWTVPGIVNSVGVGTHPADLLQGQISCRGVRQSYSDEILPWTLLDDCTDHTDWTAVGAGATVESDSTYSRIGRKSVKLTSGAGTSGSMDLTVNQVFDGQIKLWLYITDFSKLASMRVFLTSANFAKYFEAPLGVHHNGWNCILLTQRDFTINSGGESWDNTMTKLRFRISAASGQTPVVYLDAVYVGGRSKAKAIISFDDSNVAQYTIAYPYMQNLGFRGVIYNDAVHSSSNNVAYLTTDNLAELYDAGWDICVHGGTELTTLENVAAQKAEILFHQKLLTDNGFVRDNMHLHYAYPGGVFNDDSITALTELGFLTSRDIQNHTQANVLDNRWFLMREMIDYTFSDAQMEGRIDEAIERGGTVHLNFHKLIESGGTDSTQIYIEQFEHIMDYLKSKVDAGLIEVMTLTEWYKEAKRR